MQEDTDETPLNTENTTPPETPSFPIADKKDSAIVTHGHTRVDPYFWMRLSDEQKTNEVPDQQTRKVVQYLVDENKLYRYMCIVVYV